MQRNSSDQKNKTLDDSITSSESSSTGSDSSSSESKPTPQETEDGYAERERRAVIDSKLTFEYEKMMERIDSEPMGGFYDETFTFGATDEGAFVEFGYARMTKENRENPSATKNRGWKAHVAIDDSDRSNLAKGWNILKDIVIEEKITCKVVRPDTAFWADEEQHGKQITIYCCYNPEKDWESIFERIENALCESNVKLDIPAVGNDPVEGSLCIGYRNDDNGKGEYLSSKAAGFKANPLGFPDPFEHFNISPPNVNFHVRL